KHPNAVVTFGDDGEKFGTWPETKKHVYDNGWLRRVFDLISANENWIHTCTLAEAVRDVPPLGKVFLPEGSYREMTEWALPPERIVALKGALEKTEGTEAARLLRPFVQAGGFWRNFKVKYAESDEMYARMLGLS